MSAVPTRMRPAPSIEEFAAAGVSRILLTKLPDEDLRALVAVLGDRFDIVTA
jgi:hypothetical protein